MYSILWHTRALKQLRKLPRDAERAIRVDVTRLLPNFPSCSNVKKLTLHQYPYRLRVGDYRVFFEFDGEVKIITIEEVKKRDERTY